MVIIILLVLPINWGGGGAESTDQCWLQKVGRTVSAVWGVHCIGTKLVPTAFC